LQRISSHCFASSEAVLSCRDFSIFRAPSLYLSNSDSSCIENEQSHSLSKQHCNQIAQHVNPRTIEYKAHIFSFMESSTSCGVLCTSGAMQRRRLYESINFWFFWIMCIWWGLRGKTFSIFLNALLRSSVVQEPLINLWYSFSGIKYFKKGNLDVSM
jgi:hypothetical protein